MELELGKHIADLLREHNRVSLPGIGAFVGNYQPAKLNEDTFELAPPYKEITFSKDETWNDELLEKFIARVEEISDDEAKRKVAEAVAFIVAELNKNESFDLPGFGRLVKEAWRITFEIEEGLNLLADAFGLETISVPIPAIQPEKKRAETVETAQTIQPKHVQTETAMDEPVATNLTNAVKKKSLFPWIFSSLFLIIVILGAYLYIDGFFSSNTSVTIQPTLVAKDSIQTTPNEPVDTLVEDYTDTIETDTSEQKIVAETIDSKTEKRKALYYEEPKSENSGKKTFYIIAGSFNKLENAEKLKQTLVKEGYKPEVLTVAGPIFRVSMYSFTNKNRALQELSRLRDQNKELNIWLLGL